MKARVGGLGRKEDKRNVRSYWEKQKERNTGRRKKGVRERREIEEERRKGTERLSKR
jgi:hypothetical protein